MNLPRESLTEIDWRKIEDFFVKILIKDEYSQKSAEELGFYVSQILQDAKPLMDYAEKGLMDNEHNLEEIMEQMHMLFNNYSIFVKGYKMLMRENN